MLVAVAVGIMGSIVAYIRSRQQRDQLAQLGVVSDQWMAEHQLGASNDSRR
jgi:hypothetical protein